MTASDPKTLDNPVRAADRAAIDEAARLLRQGMLVAFPTETVYGLGAVATNGDAVAAIFAAKGRPTFKPLILHVADIREAMAIAHMDERAEALARRMWPGPLTLVLKRREDAKVSLLASAGLDTVAVRSPAHPVARPLLRLTGRPIAAPSANLSSRVSATDAAHVAAELGDKVAMILDAGPSPLGIESTVVDMPGEVPVTLRPGSVQPEEISAIVGVECRVAADGGDIKAPGMMARHYAPSTPLRLNCKTAGKDEALLAFGPKAPKESATVLNLSAKGDPTEAAANLFAMLRRLDASGAKAIAVMPIPEEGIGRAINDRLRRAAQPPDEPKASA